MNKLTIVIPTFNQSAYLEQALTGIEKQTCQNFDLIICDNCSHDNTEEIVMAAKITNLVYIKEKSFLDKTRNWNRAIHYSMTEYTMLHHADDILAPNAVKYILQAIEENPYVSLLHGKCHIIDLASNVIRRPLGYPLRYKYKYEDNIIQHVHIVSIVGVTFKTAEFKQVGGFDQEDYKQLQDWDYCIRLSMNHELMYIPKFMGYCRVGNLSSELLSAQIFETLFLYNKYHSINTFMGRNRIITLILKSKIFYEGFDNKKYEELINKLKENCNFKAGKYGGFTRGLIHLFFKPYIFILKAICSFKYLFK